VSNFDSEPLLNIFRTLKGAEAIPMYRISTPSFNSHNKLTRICHNMKIACGLCVGTSLSLIKKSKRKELCQTSKTFIDSVQREKRLFASVSVPIVCTNHSFYHSQRELVTISQNLVKTLPPLDRPFGHIIISKILFICK
jgi:hypothetical protein